MRLSRAALLLGLVSVVFSTLGFAVQPDRITQPISSGQMVALKGNVHGLARAQFDLGRADRSRMLHHVSLAFHPSAAQQKDLDLFLTQLQDPSSPKYHKFLTTRQFADRFGMTQNDVNQIVSWLQSQGFTNISVANSRNEISFDGTVAQVELTFNTEFHNYLVDGNIHLANATEPSVPAALAGTVLAVGHLHNFAPKPHLTSYVSGNHYLTPADFATIYNLQPLYTAGNTGSGQKIAIVGQSKVSPTDLSNFRSAAGLSSNPPTLTLIEGTDTTCSGDEGESDLDLEWSGGVAKDATIIFLYAGLDLASGDACGQARNFNVWDAVFYAVQNNVAPFISTSYGFYEAGNGQAFALQVQGWAQQGQTQGQTIVSASGDAGAADGDGRSTSATHGLTVDMPASIPEVTGAGGNEFTGDVAGVVTGTPPNTTAAGDPPYWSGSGAGTDTISSALIQIPEMAWNDTTLNSGVFSASGGGASIYFAKPVWQVGTGVPNDGKRDVPDISLTASQFHDPYLFCSEDSANGATSCSTGFRAGAGGKFTAVGGTSAVAPTFSGILALLNQYLGNVPPAGLAPVNPTLYQLAASSPSPFQDVTSGNNIVACTTGTAGCTTGSYGFSAGVGYDQVTGLGSVDAFALAQAWAGTRVSSSTALTSSTAQTYQSGSVTLTASVTPSTATGYVAFSNGSTALGTVALDASGNAQLQTGSLPIGTNNITAKYLGSGAVVNSTSSAVTVTILQAFSLTPGATSYQVSQGSPVIAMVNVTFTNGFTGTITFTCSDPAPESSCTPPPSINASGQVSFAITTKAPVTALNVPSSRGMRVFYAALLPGLLGIMLTAGSRKRSLRGMRLLGLIVALGLSTLWLGACSNSSSSSNRDPGTPVGMYTIGVTAGTGAVSGQTTFTLNVVP